MIYSISSTQFSNIDWDNFKDRPPIDESMTFCEEKNWNDDVKCCMDGYSIEHVRDIAYEHGLEDVPEVRFLDRATLALTDLSLITLRTESKACLLENCRNRLSLNSQTSSVFPKQLADSIRPYLCRD